MSSPHSPPSSKETPSSVSPLQLEGDPPVKLLRGPSFSPPKLAKRSHSQVLRRKASGIHARPVKRKPSACQNWLRAVEESLPFQALVVLVIVMDVVVSLVYMIREEKTPLWFEIMILVILWLDITCRIMAHGRGFLYGKGRCMNIFELGVVIFCTAVFYLETKAESVVPTGWLRVLGRLGRFFRTCVKAHQQKNRLLKAAQREAQTRAFQILQKLVGDFLSVSEDDLHLDPLQGNFQLCNAEVQRETLEDLHLPVTVRGGFIGDLKVELGNLMSAGADKEIKVSFSDSLLIFGPIVPDWSTEAVRRRKHNLVHLLSKRLDLLAPSLGESHAGETQKMQKASGGTPIQSPGKRSPTPTRKDKMKDRFLQRLLNQLKVDFSNISLRYEDIGVLQPNPFVCGVALGKLTLAPVANPSAETGRTLWKPALKSQRSSNREKDKDRDGRDSTSSTREEALAADGVPEPPCRQQELNISQFYLFCDTDGVTSYQGNDGDGCALDEFRISRLRERLKLVVVQQLQDIFKDNPGKQPLLQGPMFRERFDEHTYILFPINATVSILRRGVPGFEPPLSVQLSVSPIQVAVDNRQVESFNRIVLHVQRWFSNSQMSCTKPLHGILELRGGASEAMHRENVRLWWQHCTRLLQVKLNLTPNQFSTNLKANLAKPLEAEYLNLVIQEYDKDDLTNVILNKDHTRCQDIQVRLPILTVLRLRLTAKRRGPCPGNCGYMVTWHSTHCCSACAKNPGTHDETCDHKCCKRSPLLQKCTRCVRIVRPHREEVDTAMDDSIYLDVEDDDEPEELDEPGQDTPTGLRVTQRTSSGSRFVYPKEGAQLEDSFDRSTTSLSSFSLQLNVEVKSVEVFVMMYSFWGTLFSCVHFGAVSASESNHGSSHGKHDRRQSHRIISNSTSSDHGSAFALGGEHYCIPVCPRTPFLSAGAEDLRVALALPWSADRGWHTGVSLEASLADVTAKFCRGAGDKERNVLEVQRFHHHGRDVVATLRLENGLTMAAPTTYDINSQALDRGRTRSKTIDLRKASVTAFPELLRGSRWTGRLRVGSTKAICFQPVVERLLHMLNAGKKQTQVELELSLFVEHLRQPRHRSDTVNRALAKLEDNWQGSMEFSVEVGSLTMEIYQRYHRASLLLTTLAMDTRRLQVECLSRPLQFKVGCVHEVDATQTQASEPADEFCRMYSAVPSNMTWDSGESDAAPGTPDELQFELPGDNTPRYCCGFIPDDGVCLTSTPISSTPVEPKSSGGDRAERPESWSSSGVWGLPWDVSVKLVSPTDVGLQVGDAARWAEDFNYLDVQARHGDTYGSWFQRQYLHDHLAQYQERRYGNTRGNAWKVSSSAKSIKRHLTDLLHTEGLSMGHRRTSRSSSQPSS